MSSLNSGGKQYWFQGKCDSIQWKGMKYLVVNFDILKMILFVGHISKLEVDAAYVSNSYTNGFTFK